MASGKRGGSTGATGPAGRRRRPPTIELTATEVEAAAAREAPRPDPPDPAESRAAPAEPPPGAAAQGEPSPGPVLAEPPPATARPNPAEANHAAAQPDLQPEEPWHAAARARVAAWIASEQRRPFVAGGIAGAAAILLVVAVFWAAGVFATRDGSADALAARLVSLEAQVRELANRPAPAPQAIDTKVLDDLAARLGKIETVVSAPRTDSALTNRVTGIEGAMRPIADAVTDLSRRIDNAAAAARDARSRADAAAAAASAAEQKAAERAGEPRVARSDVEALANRIAALEKSTKSMGDELTRRAAEDAGDRVERAAIAAEALRAAIERGDPYFSELATLRALGVEPKSLAALEPFAAAGVPRPDALADELKALTPAMLQAARGTTRESGILDKLRASAERLVRIRRVGDAAGDDPERVIARIEVKAANADLAGPLDEMAKLPEAVRAPAAAWMHKAEARGAAITAGRRLAAEALAALGKPLPAAGR
jgi:hypothetical protein